MKKTFKKKEVLSKLYDMGDLEEGISSSKREIVNPKINLSSFNGKQDMEALLDWIKNVEIFYIE